MASVRKWYAEDIAEWMERRKAGEELWEIAESVGLSESTIDNYLDRARIGGFQVYPKRNDA